MSPLRLLGASAAAGLAAALLFWLAYGPRYSTGVYASGQAWYRDEFTPFGTALIAGMLGVGVAVCAAAVLWIAGRRRG